MPVTFAGGTAAIGIHKRLASIMAIRGEFSCCFKQAFQKPVSGF
jgi:hypothetical protein